MNSAAIADVFAPVLNVTSRRMFGGHGIYNGDLIFALEVGGELYLKVNDATSPLFKAAGSSPFTYEKNGKPYVMSYWLMPEIAFDDRDELRKWTDVALQAARGSVKPPSLKTRKGPEFP